MACQLLPTTNPHMLFRFHPLILGLFLAGTCGQHQLWNINDHNTYMHPFIPGEILVDPLSLPSCLKSYQSNTTKTITEQNVQMQYAQQLDGNVEVCRSLFLFCNFFGHLLTGGSNYCKRQLYSPWVSQSNKIVNCFSLLLHQIPSRG